MHMGHDAYIYDMTHSCLTCLIHTWHDSFMCVTWPIHMWHDSFICDQDECDSFICNMIHSYANHVPYEWVKSHTRPAGRMCDYTWHDSFMCVTRIIHMWHDSFIFDMIPSHPGRMCDLTYSYVCVTWLICMFDEIHSYAGRDSFTCVTWLIHMHDVTHSHGGHDFFKSVTWLTHMRDMPQKRIDVE